MSYKEAKSKAISCLINGDVLHESRRGIELKNLFSVGDVSANDVIDILNSSRGSSYKVSPHHQVSDQDVHVITTCFLGKNWYVKWYFVDPDCIFISVHN